MDDTGKDLQDIRRFGSIEHSQRIDLLNRYTEALKGPSIEEQCWLTAGALLWAGVHLLNSHLIMIKIHATGIVEESPQCLKDTCEELRSLVPIIRTLQARLPHEVSKFDEIISYAGQEYRSWLDAAISEADMFTIPKLEINATIVERIFESINYNPSHVRLRLEIEQKTFEKIRFHSKQGRNDGSTFETSIGAALERLRSVEVNPDQNGETVKAIPETSTLLAERQANQGTTEGTKSATSGDNAGNSEKKSKRKFCDRCQRLKENWFNRIRSGGDIPLQTFLKEFFVNPRKELIWNPVRNGKPTPTKWEPMEKKFRDNEDDWKPEYLALLAELQGTIGGH
jgi:hypothetical protein